MNFCQFSKQVFSMSSSPILLIEPLKHFTSSRTYNGYQWKWIKIIFRFHVFINGKETFSMASGVFRFLSSKPIYSFISSNDILWHGLSVFWLWSVLSPRLMIGTFYCFENLYNRAKNNHVKTSRRPKKYSPTVFSENELKELKTFGANRLTLLASVPFPHDGCLS